MTVGEASCPAVSWELCYPPLQAVKLAHVTMLKASLFQVFLTAGVKTYLKLN